MTIQDVNRVIKVVAEKGQLHIAYLWQDATRDERLLLLAAKELLDREGQATPASVHRFLNGRGVDPGDLPEAARCLQRKEILAAEAGQLSFRIDLLRRWLERHHDLETFVLSQAS